MLNRKCFVIPVMTGATGIINSAAFVPTEPQNVETPAYSKSPSKKMTKKK